MYKNEHETVFEKTMVHEKNKLVTNKLENVKN